MSSFQPSLHSSFSSSKSLFPKSPLADYIDPKEGEEEEASQKTEEVATASFAARRPESLSPRRKRKAAQVPSSMRKRAPEKGLSSLVERASHKSSKIARRKALITSPGQEESFEQDQDLQTTVNPPKKQQDSRNLFGTLRLPNLKAQQGQMSPHSRFSPVAHQPKMAAHVNWQNKQPELCLNVMTINALEYPVEFLGAGKFHKVFKFAKLQPIPIAKYPDLTTDQVVLKILNRGNLGSAKRENIEIDKEMKAYQQLCIEGVPVPKMFADPINFQDSINAKNGKFWIVEKMEGDITGKEWEGEIAFDQLDEKCQGILQFAAYWLTKMAVEGRDIINDFRKRNTMLDSKGQPKIVDFSPSETEDDEIEDNLYIYVRDWSNGNLNIALELIKNFPKEKQQRAWDFLTKEEKV